MSRKSSADSKVVFVRGQDIPPHTAKDIARLKRSAKRPIDTTDMPEQSEEFWRRSSLGPLSHRVVPLNLPSDVASAVEKAGVATVSRILRRHLLNQPLPSTRKAG